MSVEDSITADPEGVLIEEAERGTPRHCAAAWLERAGFVDEPADPDGTWSGMILPRKNYQLLWALSWLSLVSAIVAVVRGMYDLAVVPFGVWLTSLLYWYKPDYSWRRYADMIWVQVALWYQVARAYGAENMVAYYAINGEYSAYCSTVVGGATELAG
jgi:hypothetical protein